MFAIEMEQTSNKYCTDSNKYPNVCPQTIPSNGGMYRLSHVDENGRCCYTSAAVPAFAGGRRSRKRSTPTPPCPTICIVGQFQNTFTAPCSGQTQALTNASIAAPYINPLVASGGTSPYIFTTNPLDLPLGFTLSPSGVITGTPTQGAGETFTFTVQATDANGCTGFQTFSIFIEAN